MYRWCEIVCKAHNFKRKHIDATRLVDDLMTDAKWDSDDQRKIRSSSLLHKKNLPFHRLHLAFPSVLETLASPVQPEVDLLASNC
jgi:hypothetical protein